MSLICLYPIKHFANTLNVLDLLFPVFERIHDRADFKNI